MKALFLTLAVLPLFSHAAVVEPKNGAVKFLASASPGALAIHGTGDAPTGKLELSEKGDKVEVSGTLRLSVASLQTGITLRDRHMKERYLETDKYPDAILSLTKQALPKRGTGAFDGELELHGVKHKVSGQAEFADAGGGRRTVKASFPVSLSDYGVQVPSFAGVSVANQVSVETELQLGAN